MRTLILLIIAAGIFYACDSTLRKEDEKRSVALTIPVPQEQSLVKKWPGIVKEAHHVSLGFKTAGQIEKIHVEDGDYVRKGQLLAELDASDYRLGVEALRIQYSQLEKEVERITQLFNSKSVSANDYEKAVSGLKQLGIQLQVNENKLSYTKLYAPTDGYIQSVNFSPAEMVDAGTAMFTLLDVSRMEVVADIPAEEYRRRGTFTGYSCQVTGIEGNMPMTSPSFSPKADDNQLYQLRLAFAEKPNRQLTAGLNVEVSITMTDTVSPTGYTLPLRSVFYDNGNTCVWVLNPDSTVSKRHVVTSGTDSKGHAVITEGLNGGEQVVRAGVNSLQAGEKVRIITSPEDSNIGGLL